MSGGIYTRTIGLHEELDRARRKIVKHQQVLGAVAAAVRQWDAAIAAQRECGRLVVRRARGHA